MAAELIVAGYVPQDYAESRESLAGIENERRAFPRLTGVEKSAFRPLDVV